LRAIARLRWSLTGAEVIAYDPEGIEQARPLLDKVTYAADAYACAEGADPRGEADAQPSPRPTLV
jgi:hypothetical protein